MLFNSYEFIFAFLPLTFFVYFYLLQKRLTIEAKGFLVFVSKEYTIDIILNTKYSLIYQADKKLKFQNLEVFEMKDFE